jgi:hypothetical protein
MTAALLFALGCFVGAVFALVWDWAADLISIAREEGE